MGMAREARYGLVLRGSLGQERGAWRVDAGYGRAVEVRKASVERTGGEEGKAVKVRKVKVGRDREGGKAVELSQGHEARRRRLG